MYSFTAKASSDTAEAAAELSIAEIALTGPLVGPRTTNLTSEEYRSDAIPKKYTPAISVGRPTMAQNQIFSDPRNRASASARPRGRAPAIAVAPLTTAWARRTKSTIANYRVSTGRSVERARDDRRAAPVLGRVRHGL